MSELQDTKAVDQSTKPRGDVHRIKYGSFEFSIPTIAFGLMLVGILLPTANFSLSLKHPSPSELLIAICMALFSSIVFLWILDATSVLRFRSEWVSKSIYGAAIVSVLGTSVGVYKEAFSERKYQFEGRWEIQIRNEDTLIASNELIMMYSTTAETYWGFSDHVIPNKDSNVKINWLKVNDFDDKSGGINISFYSESGLENVIQAILQNERNGRLFIGSFLKKGEDGKEAKININMSRPKN